MKTTQKKFCLFLIFLSFLSGCSGSWFSKKDKNNELKAVQGTGEINENCLGLDLSDSPLNPPTARALIRCLNANGSIQEYAALVDKMSDPQLNALLVTLDQHLVRNPQRLKSLDVTIEQMDQRGILKEVFEKLSLILENPRLVRSGIKILKQASGSMHDQHEHAPFEIDPALLKMIQILGEELQSEAGEKKGLKQARKNVAHILEAAQVLLSLQAYQELVRGLQAPLELIDPIEGTLEVIARRLFVYLQEKIQESPHALGRLVGWGIADGSLFQGVDHYLMSSCDDKKPVQCDGPFLAEEDQIIALNELLKSLTIARTDGIYHREKILKPLVDLFKVGNGPIRCMANTKEVPNMDLYVMDELSRLAPLEVPLWVTRDNILKIAVANGLCTLPSLTEGETQKTFQQLIAVLRDLARYKNHPQDTSQSPGFGRPLITVTHLVNALKHAEQFPLSSEAKKDLANLLPYPEQERYRRLSVQWLGDAGKSNIYSHLSQGLMEMVRPERNAVLNALYLLNYPEKKEKTDAVVHRKDVEKLARVFMVLRPHLKTESVNAFGTNPKEYRSIYDIVVGAVRNVNQETFVDFVMGAKDLILDPQPIAKPLVEMMREALVMNDVEPVLETALEIAAQADQKKELFEALFDVVDTDEFHQAMRLTAKMAKNGTLSELIKSMIALFRGTAKRAAHQPVALAVSEIGALSAEKDMSSASVKEWSPTPAIWSTNGKGLNACQKINFDLPLSHTGKSMLWTQQVEHLAACANVNQDLNEFEGFVNYAVHSRMASGKSAAAVLIEMAMRLIPEEGSLPNGFADLQRIYDELGDLLVDEKNVEDVKQFAEILPLLVKPQYCSGWFDEKFQLPQQCRQSEGENLAVLQALGRAIGLLKKNPDDLQKVLNLARTAVEHPSIFQTGYWLWDVWNEVDEYVPVVKMDQKPPLISYPLNHYQGKNHNEVLKQRIREAYLRHYHREPTDADYQEMARQYWNQPVSHLKKEYKDRNGKFRIGFANAEEFKEHVREFLEALSRPRHLEGALRFFMTLDKNPYTPEFWASWFQRASANVRPFAFYYPGNYPSKKNPPEIRLISQLEMMELLVENADFTLADLKQPLGRAFEDPHTNFAIKYLTLLAQSPDNMDPVVHAMEAEMKNYYGLINDPALKGLLKPELKRRVFNLTQIISILKELNQDVLWKFSDGTAATVNDLRLLAHLFQASLSATPPEKQHIYNRNENSLVVVAELVKMGLGKTTAAGMWSYYPQSGPETKWPNHEDDWDAQDRHVLPGKISHILRFLLEAVVVHKGKKREINPSAIVALDYLLRKDCSARAANSKKSCVGLNGRSIPFDDRFVFIGKVIDAYFKWTLDDELKKERGEIPFSATLKKIASEALLLADRLATGEHGERINLTPSLILALQSVLGTKQGTQLLAENLDLVKDLVKEPKTLAFLTAMRAGEKSRKMDFQATQALMKPLLDHAGADKGVSVLSGLKLWSKLHDKPAFDGAIHVTKWFLKDPEYLKLKNQSLDRIADQLRQWALKPSSYLRPQVQRAIGESSASGDVKDLIIFLGQESSSPKKDHFYKQVEFLGIPKDNEKHSNQFKYVERLQAFLDVLRRGIKESQ